MEGVDTAGKGTLIKELNKSLLYEVLRGSSFELTEGKSSYELFETFYEFTHLDNVILDRGHLSNMVYAPLYDDYSVLRDDYAREVERNFSGNALVIYLYADEEIIKQRFITRGEEYVDESKIKSILHSYENVLDYCELDVLHFDTGKLSVDEIVNIVLDYV